jgi:hypothetical protein
MDLLIKIFLTIKTNQMAKSVLFKIKLEGEGIVNFDSSEQSIVHKNYNTRYKPYAYDNNVMYAKKNFYTKEDGTLDWKIKISSNDLFHHIFKNDVFSQNPSIQKSDNILYNFISSPINIMRGYVFAGKNTIKKKSPICITDAEQVSDTLANIEVMVKSGKKDGGIESKKSDTLFFKENVGKIEYSAKGSIDLSELQFLSCSDEFDRYGFNPDNLHLFNKFFNIHIAKLGLEPKTFQINHYSKKGNLNTIPEEGILFDEETVISMVKMFFANLLKTYIQRHGAYARISSIEYKLVDNAFIDTFSSENDWENINNKNDIDAMNFSVENYYIEQNIDEINKMDDEIKNYNNKEKESADKKKADKEAFKESKKNTKNKENEQISVSGI